jgi:hypothetical protein
MDFWLNKSNTPQGIIYMAAVEYKEFQLSPCPYQFHGTGEWIVRVKIAKQNDSSGEIRIRQFCSSKIFQKRKDADHHAILFGKEIIDGKHQHASVDNLY